MRTRRNGLSMLGLCITLVLLPALVLGASACGQAPAAPAAQPTAGGEVAGFAQTPPKVLKIGASVPRTGNFHLEGELIRQGYEIFADSVNSKGGFQVGNDTYTVQMVIYDDQSDQNTAARLAERLITEDQVDFVFGPFGSALTLAVLAVTEKYQKLLMNPSGNADALFEQNPRYMVGVLRPASTLINPFIDMLNSLPDPPSTVAIVSKNDLFGQTQRRGVTQHIAASGGPRIVLDEAYPVGAADYSTLINQVRAASPDVVIEAGHEECVTFYTQMRQQGYQPKAYFCSGFSPTDFSRTAGDASTNVFGYVAGWDPSAPWSDDVIGTGQDYMDKSQALFGKPIPSYVTVNAAGAGVLLVKAIQEAGSTDTQAVREALGRLKITIAAGPIDFDDVGRNRTGAIAISQITSAQDWILVYPPDRRTQDPVYPVPGSQ